MCVAFFENKNLEPFSFDFFSHTSEFMGIGKWVIELDNNIPPRMYCDELVRSVLGVSSDATPEECYSKWQNNVFSSHVSAMQSAVSKILHGEKGDICYLWNSPNGEAMYIRSCGVKDEGYTAGTRIIGCFQDVTDIITNEKKYNSENISSQFLLQVLSSAFEAVHTINLRTKQIDVIKAVIPEFWQERDITVQKFLQILRNFFKDDDNAIDIIEQSIYCININRTGRDKPIFYSEDLKNEYHGITRWYNLVMCIDHTSVEPSLIIAFRDISEREQNRSTIEQLKSSSEIDGLTKVLNRITIEQQIDTYFSLYPNDSCVLLLLDLDNFKAVNDKIGHVEGDRLLVETADKLRHFCRSTDKIGRLGGDEFIIFLTTIEREDVHSFITRLIGQIKKEYKLDDSQIDVTASIGVSCYPYDGKSFAELYQCADIALYEAKNNGKNGYATYTEKTS